MSPHLLARFIADRRLTSCVFFRPFPKSLLFWVRRIYLECWLFSIGLPLLAHKPLPARRSPISLAISRTKDLRSRDPPIWGLGINIRRAQGPPRALAQANIRSSGQESLFRKANRFISSGKPSYFGESKATYHQQLLFFMQQ